MNNAKVFKKQNVIVVGCILGGLMIIGSFFDYQISQFFFNSKSSFGIFFAGYGQTPVALCMSVAGMLLISITQNKNKLLMCLSYLGGVILILFAIAMITIDPLLYMKGMNLFVSLGIAITIVILTNRLLFKLTQGTKREDIKKFIILLLLTAFLAIFVINVMKVFWGRPRMRMLAETPKATFQPWWVIGSYAKEHFMALGVAAEEFKSFPSGHSANAACAMLIGALPFVCQSLKGKEDILFYIGLGLTLIIAFSRIIMGAHFISDITVGISMTFIVELICIRLLWKRSSISNG